MNKEEIGSAKPLVVSQPPIKTKYEIIEELAKNKVVEEIVNNTAKGSYPDTDDFINDIYLELLEKPEDKIQQLYEKKQIKFFISRMITNNLFSANSRYYYKYQIWNNKRTELKEFKTTDKENDYTGDL